MGIFDRFFGPPTLDKFANIIIEALRSAGDTRSAQYDQAEARLMFTSDGKDAGMMNLRNLYGEYCSLRGRERQEWIRRTTSGLINRMELPEDFEDVKPDLFPTVRPKSMLEFMRLDAEVQGGNCPDVAMMPLSEHLVVCLVYDLPNSMRFVSQGDLTKWGTTVYEAMEVAKRNLEEKQFSTAGIEGKLYVLANGDAYDATRMLLIDAIRTLELTGDAVAVPLARDVLLIAGSDDQQGLGLMLEMVEQQKDSPRPVCPVPHLLVEGGWQPWTPSADSPHFDRFRLLEIEYLAGEYAEQKRLMEQRNEQTGTDVFVASFSAMEKEGKGLSYAVWSETVPTWLPKSHYVAFLNEDQNPLGFVPWDRVEAIMGDSMGPLDCYPPRWFVETFPDHGQLAELQPSDLPD